MNTIVNPHDPQQRQSVRHTLLEHGYKPLPLAGKAIRIKKWSSLTVDSAFIDQYKRTGSMANTGIRCDNLIAFDIDVLDEYLADALDIMVYEALGAKIPCRIGRYPKRLLLFRLDNPMGEPISSRRTGRYRDDDGDVHMVELLCGPGRQFAAYGVHPGTGEPYDWCDGYGDPLSVPVTDLIPVTYQRACEVMDRIEDYLAQHGELERVSSATLAGAQGGEVADLTPDTDCLVDGAVVLWGDLRGDLDTAGVFGNLRREDGEFGDSDAVHFMLAQGSGQPVAYDFPYDTLHTEPVVATSVDLPPVPDESMFGDAGETAPPIDDEYGALREMHETFVMMGDGRVKRLHQPAQEALPFVGFKSYTAHQTIPAPTKTNPDAVKPAAEAWRVSPAAYRAAYAEMRPDRPCGLYSDDDGLVCLNTYRPPEFTDAQAARGEYDTFMEFLAHLVPNSRERDAVLGWVVTKIRRPAERMHGLVMVAPGTFGTGRGTFTAILGRLLGDQYVSNHELTDVIGKGSQGRYNAFLADSLLVSIPEAFDATEQDHYLARRQAFDSLKALCDPTATRMKIKRKYGAESVSRVYASLLIATNHVDALAIEEGDRRFIVVSNGGRLVEAPDDLAERIHQWYRDDSNLAAFVAWARSRAAVVDYDPHGEPMMTDAKKRMIDSARSDMEQAYEWIVEEAPGSCMTPAQFKLWAHKAAAELDLSIAPQTFDRACSAVLRKTALKYMRGNGGRIKVFGSKQTVWILRDNRELIDADTDVVRGQLLVNGDPGDWGKLP